MSEQFTLDIPSAENIKDDFFLVDPSNQEAFDLSEDLSLWSARRLVLQGPPKSGKSLLLEAARQNGADIEDDVDQKLSASADKAEYEKDLFHRLNWAEEQSGHIMLTAQKPAILWPIDMPDLKSRLLSTPQTILSDPSDELLRKLLVKEFSNRQMKIEPNVLAFVATRIERSHKSVIDIVAKLDREALKARKNLTLPFVRRVLVESL